MAALDMIKCACVVLGCFTLAGIAQTLFYKHPVSIVFAVPLDMGRTWRGVRIFGNNKTWKGIVVLVPVTTLCFVGVGVLSLMWPWFACGLWLMSLLEWAGLGLAASVGYVLGELPNSFIKRRLGIEPGGTAKHPVLRRFFIVWDQFDSLCLGLIAIAFMVETTWVFYAVCLALGATIHWLFNVLFYFIGLKKEAR